MAFIAGGILTETSPSAQSTIPHSTALPSNDLTRAPKRPRDPESVSPRSRDAQIFNPLASPSKAARISIATKTRSLAPLTGAAALEDEHQRSVEERTANSRSISPNLPHTALESLMSGVTEAVSRPSDAPQLAPTASMEPAAKAATALSMAAENAARSVDRDENSQHVNAGVASPAPVTDSPAPMEVDATKAEHAQNYQSTPQDERSQPGSLSYPGSLQAVDNMAEPPARGMSFPMPGQVQSSPTSSTGKKHKCPYCSTEFTRHHNLKSHLLTHSQEKPYVCTQCQMRFRRLHDLKRHGKLHTGEKPHICPKCDRKFARGDALARHAKGAGGCAGRRSSMGSFAEGDDMDGTMGEGDDSAMSGVAFDNPDDEELRRQSLPSIGSQHHPSSDNYGAHSRTYPQTGSRPAASGLYAPNVNQGQAGTANSSSVPDSLSSNHTATTSVASLPGGSGAGVYSQASMTESPKPLSPGITGHDLAKPRSPGISQQHQSQQQMGRRSSELQPPHSGQVRSKLPALSHAGFPTPNSGGYSVPGRTANDSHPAGDSGNMFAQSDPSVWEYIRLLEDKIKSLSDKLVSLDNDVVELKKQLDARDGVAPA